VSKPSLNPSIPNYTLEALLLEPTCSVWITWGMICYKCNKMYLSQCTENVLVPKTVSEMCSRQKVVHMYLTWITSAQIFSPAIWEEYCSMSNNWLQFLQQTSCINTTTKCLSHITKLVHMTKNTLLLLFIHSLIHSFIYFMFNRSTVQQTSRI
jgi:hypothetical protein